LSEDFAPVLVGLFAGGIGLSFLLADRQSPSSRAFALALGLLALMFASAPVRGPGLFLAPEVWERLTGLLEAAILLASCEWLYRVSRTMAPADPRSGRSARLLRSAQIFAVAYGLTAVLFVAARRRYSQGGWGPEVLLEPLFFLVLGPSLISFVLAVAGAVLVARSEIDVAERLRLRAAGLAVPFLFSGLPMQPPWEYLTTAIGEIIFLAGSVQYYVLQGKRGQFLARFLSPQVAQLVRERGLAAALERRRAEISVVAFDLRGFTAFAEKASPDAVMEVIQDYYAAIGEEVTRSSATIKDFAGDGILCLVGAPLPQSDHARRALALALAARERVSGLLTRRSGASLGLGVGVASGPVTIGAVGGEARLEYAAVGPAVNLAARLCEQASAGEVVADAATIAEAGAGAAADFEPGGSLSLKGVTLPVAVYRVRANRV